jgi:D-amino peptidase
MEGISGVVDRSQISPPGIDFDRGRRLLTDDANAAVRGAVRAGAREIVVSGGHGANGMRNIIDEQLHEAAWLVSGDTRRSMMEALDASFSAAVLIGYHARHGRQGVLDHTISARDVFEIRVEGRPIGEIGLSGLAAGRHGVPVVLVSGDDRLEGETREWFPWAMPVVVKYAIGRHAARCMHPLRAQQLIERSTTDALHQLDRMRPLRAEPPIAVEVQFKTTAHADEAERAPGASRADDCTVATRASDVDHALRFVQTCIKLGATAPSALAR